MRRFCPVGLSVSVHKRHRLWLRLVARRALSNKLTSACSIPFDVIIIGKNFAIFFKNNGN